MKRQTFLKVGVILSAVLLAGSSTGVIFADTMESAYKPKTHVLKANSETVRWGILVKVIQL